MKAPPFRLQLALAIAAAGAILPSPACAGSVTGVEGDPISEVVVTSRRRSDLRQLHPGNIDRLGPATIEDVQHQHISELMSRVAGAWIVRGSGQEHQTSIRSPVLSGAGSCAGFLFLEDGIPIRPAGFCNVNLFTELDTEQAEAIEVIRGPGNALFGANALHGIVNVLMPAPGRGREPLVGLELGANSFIRARAALPLDRTARWLASVLYASDGGFRDDSGYRQAKLHLKRNLDAGGGELTVGFTATDLAQDTAGFIYGEDAYEDAALSRSNPDAGAFRNTGSQRLYGLWRRDVRGIELDLRPYLRHSDMAFMHYALPGKPVEENGQVSAGVISSAMLQSGDWQTIIGLDFEWADVFLGETQAGPAEGNAVQRETRPRGKHYDYGVETLGLATYLQTTRPFGDRWQVSGGMRLDYLHYDYRNHMLAGNTRDDGTPCGFGGCLYTRPGDRSDSFINFAPNASLSYSVSERTSLFADYARGFRPPQTTELYHLQSGQQVADLGSERVDAMELGWRRAGRNWLADLSLFTMRKQDSVFRDADGYNVSGGRSRHKGVETSIDWQIDDAWRLRAAASYARHTYDFTYLAGRGEKFIAGRDIDSAPRWLGSAELLFRPTDVIDLGLQWTMLGAYYLDAENRYSYPGHTLVNLRVGIRVARSFDCVLRLNNLVDRRYADRADFGAGDYRYLPGRGREWFVALRYSPE